MDGNSNDDNSVKDSYNDHSNNSITDASNNSSNMKDSGNTTDTSHIFDMDQVVASSVLMGSVARTTVTYGMSDENKGDFNVTHSNNIDNSFSTVSGITTIGQNSGANSMVQQSVTTNASVFTD
jgi:hypothetical protein